MDSIDPAADRRLLSAARTGDPHALSRAAHRLAYIPRIMRALNARAGHPLADPDVEDASGDAVTAAWRKADRFDGRVRLESWLYGFALVEFRRARRRRAQRRQASSDSSPEVVDRREDPVDAADREGAVAEAMETLPDEERVVVALKHFDDLTFEEIAERLEIPVGTSKSRYYRALRLLRQRLSERSES